MNEEQITSCVTLCPDGKYRWAYEVNLYRNPTIRARYIPSRHLCLQENAIMQHVLIISVLRVAFRVALWHFAMRLQRIFLAEEKDFPVMEKVFPAMEKVFPTK